MLRTLSRAGLPAPPGGPPAGGPPGGGGWAMEMGVLVLGSWGVRWRCCGPGRLSWGCTRLCCCLQLGRKGHLTDRASAANTEEQAETVETQVMVVALY